MVNDVLSPRLAMMLGDRGRLSTSPMYHLTCKSSKSDGTHLMGSPLTGLAETSASVFATSAVSLSFHISSPRGERVVHISTNTRSYAGASGKPLRRSCRPVERVARSGHTLIYPVDHPGARPTDVRRRVINSEDRCGRED